MFLSKLIEHAVDKQLYEHMSLNKLHYKYQHAYKKCHSTETLLLCVVNDILIAFDNNNGVIIIVD